jgi:hypothetical protein
MYGTYISPDFSDEGVEGVIYPHSRLGRRLDEGDSVIPARIYLIIPKLSKKSLLDPIKIGGAAGKF